MQQVFSLQTTNTIQRKTKELIHLDTSVYIMNLQNEVEDNIGLS